MRHLSWALFLILCLSCREQKPDANLFNTPYRIFTELPALASFQKVIDTVISPPPFYDPKYRMLHLRDNKSHLIVFDSIVYDSLFQRTYYAMDTLAIPPLEPQHMITMGYCYLGDAQDENIIALVEKTDRMKIKMIISAWQANPISGKIEPLELSQRLRCLNEFYSGESIQVL